MLVTDEMIEAGCRVQHSPIAWGKAVKNPAMASWVYSHREIMRRTLTAAIEVREQSDGASEARLPCDVHLPPATYIRRGCTVATLMAGLRHREKFPDDMRSFSPHQEQSPVALESWAIIEQLRAPEGASVTLICDNPDFDMGANSAVEVNDYWTGHENVRFEGDTVLEALRVALKASKGEVSSG